MAGFYGRTGIEVRDTLTGGMERLRSYIQEAMYVSAMAGAEVVQGRAKELCPVSAGLRGNCTDGSHMVDHIDIEIYRQAQGVSARIGVFDTSICNYAPHVEFGMHGRPFLRPAVDETRDQAHQVMQQTFNEQLMEGFDVHTAVRFRRFA